METDDKELLKLTDADIKQFIEELGVFTKEFIKKKIEEKQLTNNSINPAGMSAEDFAKNITALVELKTGEQSISDPFIYIDKITIVGAITALKEFAKQEAEKAFDAGRETNGDTYDCDFANDKETYINNLFK